MRMSSEHNMNVVQSIQKDMSSLLRRIKQRQDDHCRIYQYCNQIISRKQQITDDIYIHDQIMKIKKYIEQKHSLSNNHQDLDTQICPHYELITQIKSIIAPTLKKVVNKVMELSSASIQSLKEPPDYYNYIFAKFKAKFVELYGNQNSKVNLKQMINSISCYLHHKTNVQLQRLKLFIKFLQLSDHKGIQDLRDLYYKRLKHNECKKTQQSLDSSPLYNTKIVQKKDFIMKNIHSQRDIKFQRPKLIKYDEKKKPHQRKLQLKRLKKYVHNLCEVMQIGKDQLLEQMSSQNKQWQSKRIYLQLCGRNKHNLAQISQFIDRTSSFDDCIKLNQQNSLFVNHEERTITLEEQLLKKQAISTSVKHHNYRDKNKQHYQRSQKWIIKKQIVIQRKQPLKIKSRFLNKKQKVEMRNRAPNGSIGDGVESKAKQIFNSDKYADSNDFIQIDIKQQEIRQRLPDIYHRAASSVDNSKIIKKESIHRINKSDKKALTSQKQQFVTTQQINLKVSNRSEMPSRNSLTEKTIVKNKPPNLNKQEPKGKQKMEQKIRLQLRTMGSNFFEEIGKKISKFCEMKKNSDF